jgi:hypothetical protein
VRKIWLNNLESCPSAVFFLFLVLYLRVLLSNSYLHLV